MSVAEEMPSVNFHLWEPCNMKCGFCFATFQDVKQDILPKGHMGEDGCISVVELLAGAGFDKINFAGGEPTLCPWLPVLVKKTKEVGLTTAIVTNGSRITSEWLDGLEGCLDWVTLSIDTVDAEKLKRLGRTTPSGPMTEDDYLRIVDMLGRRGIRFKVNTVVNSVNWEDDFTGFIMQARPERWKLLQVLAVAGQNDRQVGGYTITKEQFDQYVARNRSVEREGIIVVPESNELMTGSYVMVDPAGRFFDNVMGTHTYSRPINEVGIEEALKDVTVLPGRFMERGGMYRW